MIWIVTTKEYAMTEFAYVNLDGKNKLIVQVHNFEKVNQTFNTITNLNLFLLFLPKIFTAQMTAIVMKKDHATMLLETVFVRKGGMVSMTAHFVSLESMFHFKKVLFSSFTIL